MRKFACLLLSLLLLVAVLCACTPEDNGKIKITVGFWPDASLSADTAMYNEWKANFERDYPQYEIVASPYTYSPETVRAKGNAGELPTIFQTYFTEPEMLIREGYIRPITQQLNELGWADKMDDSMRKTLTKNGEIYGVPRDGYGLGLFINLRLMYDIGAIDKNPDGTYKLYQDDGTPNYPRTFDEITDLCRVVQEECGRDKYGILILSANKQGGWQLCNMGWNFGATHLQTQNADGTWKSNLMDEGMVNALRWIQSLAEEELCYPGASYNYDNWPEMIGNERVLMAFVGSDALSMPITSYGFSKDDFAFVPMPTGDGTSRYALFGGTPYVFADNATDEQVAGALKFLHYIGRSPEVDDITISAMEKGFAVAESKGMPILPTIKPWKDPAYVELANRLENQHVNVNYTYMKDFFDTIEQMKHDEEPNFCQEMYGILDNSIQNVLSQKSRANPLALLTTANNNFQNNHLKRVN